MAVVWSSLSVWKTAKFWTWVLVGEKGHVTGIDMTEGQVQVDNKYIE